ncbi:MAG: hypothetical protein ACE5KG_05065 [Nitrososphaerales archaeon]
MPQPLSKEISISGRDFIIEVIMFSNGCLAVVTEGKESRLGSLSLSLKGERSLSGPSRIIPGRSNESPIADILTEALTTITDGILMVSYYAEKELLGGELRDMVEQLRNLISEQVKKPNAEK